MINSIQIIETLEYEIYKYRRLLFKHVNLSKMNSDAKGFQMWFCKDFDEVKTLQKYAIQVVIL